MSFLSRLWTYIKEEVNPIAITLVDAERYRVTLLIGIVQFVLAILSFFDRLNITINSRFEAVNIVADDNFWGGCFMISSMVVMYGLRHSHTRSVSMAISAAVFGNWGLVELVSSLSSLAPVSIAGPSLAITMSFLCVLLANIWSKIHLYNQLTHKSL